VIAPVPQAAERLLAVCPDVAELLAVMALRKSILWSTLISMWQRFSSRKISWEFAVLGKVIRKSEIIITSKPRLTSSSDMSSAGVLCGRWRITAFMDFSDLG
jgi:hypothetical protein